MKKKKSLNKAEVELKATRLSNFHMPDMANSGVNGGAAVKLKSFARSKDKIRSPNFSPSNAR